MKIKKKKKGTEKEKKKTEGKEKERETGIYTESAIDRQSREIYRERVVRGAL